MVACLVSQALAARSAAPQDNSADSCHSRWIHSSSKPGHKRCNKMHRIRVVDRHNKAMGSHSKAMDSNSKAMDSNRLTAQGKPPCIELPLSGLRWARLSRQSIAAE